MYSYFKVYRDLGPQRSLKEAAKRTKRRWDYLGQISSKNNWVARAEAWDQHLDSVRKESEVAAEEQAGASGAIQRRRIISQGMKVVEEATRQMLEKLEYRAKQDNAEALPLVVKPSDAKGLLEALVKAQRLEEGEATEVSESRAVQMDMSNLTTEELLEIKRLKKKVEKIEDHVDAEARDDVA